MCACVCACVRVCVLTGHVLRHFPVQSMGGCVPKRICVTAYEKRQSSNTWTQLHEIPKTTFRGYSDTRADWATMDYQHRDATRDVKDDAARLDSRDASWAIIDDVSLTCSDAAADDGPRVPDATRLDARHVLHGDEAAAHVRAAGSEPETLHVQQLARDAIQPEPARAELQGADGALPAAQVRCACVCVCV